MPSKKGTRFQYRCSFCGKDQDHVRRLIAGPNAVYICDECVDLCREIIEEEKSVREVDGHGSAHFYPWSSIFSLTP